MHPHFTRLSEQNKWLAGRALIRRFIALGLTFVVVPLSMLLGLVPAHLSAAPSSAPDRVLLAGCSELVLEGSFETPNSPAWTIMHPSAIYDSLEKFDGNWSMRLGIVDLPNNQSISAVNQAINLPASAATIVLSFRYLPRFDAAPGAGDLQYVDIFNNLNNSFVARPLQVQSNSPEWLFKQYDLSALRGQQIRLVFGVNNDGLNGRMAMNVDVVSVVSCTTTPTPTGTVPTFTPTPTVTPITPTPTPVPGVPPGCVDLIINGGFELDSAWQFGDSPVPPQYVGNPRYAGMRSMQLGNPPNYRPDAHSFSSVRQLITIPSSVTTAELRWWHFFRTEEPVNDSVAIGADRQEVILLNPDLSTKEVLQRVRRNEGGFSEEVRDLTPFRGQTLHVYFNVFNDGVGGRTWMNLDNVQLFGCYPGGGTPTSFVLWTPSPTPMPTPSHTPTPPPMAVMPVMPLGTVDIPEIVGGVMDAAAAGQLGDDAATSAARVAEEFATPTPTPSADDGQGLSNAGVILVLAGIVVVIGLIFWAIIRVVTRPT